MKKLIGLMGMVITFNLYSQNSIQDIELYILKNQYDSVINTANNILLKQLKLVIKAW